LVPLGLIPSGCFTLALSIRLGALPRHLGRSPERRFVSTALMTMALMS